MTEQYCRIIMEEGKLKSVGPVAVSTNIKDVIEDDKKYGIFKPKNGKYFTFRVLDVHDKEIDDSFVNKAEALSFKSFIERFNIDVKRARPGEYADFKTIFRTPENDERGVMESNTIMYHYFPISDFDNPKRGLCVVNPNWFYTSHGKMMPMHIIDPDNYDENSTAQGSTIDYDGVTRHERGHGWGLPHDAVSGTTMSTPYPLLKEFLDERTIYRLFPKYGYRKHPKIYHLTRKLKWLWFRSENY